MFWRLFKDAFATSLKYHCTADPLIILFGFSCFVFMLNEQHFYLNGKIQTSQTRGQWYSDTSFSGFIFHQVVYDNFCWKYYSLTQ